MKYASRFLWRSSLIAALGGFLFGFDTAVISGAEQAIQQLFQLSGFWHGFTVAVALIGTVVGALVSGKPADRYGRKQVLVILALLYLLSALGTAMAQTWGMLVFFRFLGGIGVGASSVIGPMYIAEIAPAEKRGRLVALFQLNVVLGILCAYFSNYLIEIWVEANSWRWMLGMLGVPSFIFLVLLYWIPSTPRWLIMHGKKEEARNILKLLGERSIDERMNVIEDSVFSEKHIRTTAFFTRRLRLPIMLAFLVAFFNQFSGINAIMYYAPRIFEIAGLDRASALSQSVAVGLTNMIFTLIALSIIDKFGRKKLLLTGSVGMIIALSLVAVTFLKPGFGGSATLIGLIGFIAFFAASQGAVIWVYISEIFPNNVRAKGQTLGSSTHWVLAALVSWVFPIVVRDNPVTTGGTFVFFAFMMLVQLIVVKRVFPETKGKSLEEIQNEFGL